EDLHDELHGREVVVVHENLVAPGTLGLVPLANERLFLSLGLPIRLLLARHRSVVYSSPRGADSDAKRERDDDPRREGPGGTGVPSRPLEPGAEPLGPRLPRAHPERERTGTAH